MHLINFSQRKVIKYTSMSMYGHPLKVTDSMKLLEFHVNNYLSMKRHVEHVERASLISKIRITRLNSISATLLIRFLLDHSWSTLVPF